MCVVVEAMWGNRGRFAGVAVAVRDEPCAVAQR